jgi:hypothetical protein
LPTLKINKFSPKIKSGRVAHLDARTQAHVTVGLLGVPHFADIKINQFSPKIKSGSVAHLDVYKNSTGSFDAVAQQTLRRQ